MADTAVNRFVRSERRHQAPGLRVVREDEASIVWLTGEHDIATVPAFRALLADLAAVAAYDTDVVIDISELTFFDSSVIDALEAGKLGLRTRDRWLSVRGGSPRARRLFEICGSSDLFVARAAA